VGKTGSSKAKKTKPFGQIENGELGGLGKREHTEKNEKQLWHREVAPLELTEAKDGLLYGSTGGTPKKKAGRECGGKSGETDRSKEQGKKDVL